MLEELALVEVLALVLLSLLSWPPSSSSSFGSIPSMLWGSWLPQHNSRPGAGRMISEGITFCGTSLGLAQTVSFTCSRSLSPAPAPGFLSAAPLSATPGALRVTRAPSSSRSLRVAKAFNAPSRVV